MAYAAEYKHGVYGEQVPFANSSIPARGTVPAYIGTAPIQQVNTQGAADFDYSPYINTPLLIKRYRDVESSLGYSTDWANFTLCEAVSAHFLAGDAPIGPIVCVNMTNPAKLASDNTETPVTLSGAAGDKTGVLSDPLAAIENVTLSASSGALVKDTDYTMSYVDGAIQIHVTKSGFSDSTVTATYKQIDVTQTTLTSTVFAQALAALDVAEVKTGEICNILAAPGWSHLPAYHTELLAKANDRLAKKWYTIAVSDIPADSTTNTPATAMEWKEENQYTDRLDKVCWPMTTFQGQKYHLSTLAAVDMQTVDTGADGIPYISPSNKAINADATILEDGTEVFVSEVTGNSLNEVGITTVNIIRGGLRLWGPHMANYDFNTEEDMLPEDKQDASIRMGLYLLNYLQYNYIDQVDMPFARRDIDAVLASVQQWLNALVNAGQLLYATVSFDADDNTTDAMISGDFVFNIKDTFTPNAKSLTFRCQYTTAGLSSLTGGETA